MSSPETPEQIEEHQHGGTYRAVPESNANTVWDKEARSGLESRRKSDDERYDPDLNFSRNRAVDVLEVVGRDPQLAYLALRTGLPDPEDLLGREGNKEYLLEFFRGRSDGRVDEIKAEERIFLTWKGSDDQKTRQADYQAGRLTEEEMEIYDGVHDSYAAIGHEKEQTRQAYAVFGMYRKGTANISSFKKDDESINVSAARITLRKLKFSEEDVAIIDSASQSRLIERLRETKWEDLNEEEWFQRQAFELVAEAAQVDLPKVQEHIRPELEETKEFPVLLEGSFLNYDFEASIDLLFNLEENISSDEYAARLINEDGFVVWIRNDYGEEVLNVAASKDNFADLVPDELVDYWKAITGDAKDWSEANRDIVSDKQMRNVELAHEDATDREKLKDKGSVGSAQPVQARVKRLHLRGGSAAD